MFFDIVFKICFRKDGKIGTLDIHVECEVAVGEPR